MEGGPPPNYSKDSNEYLIRSASSLLFEKGPYLPNYHDRNVRADVDLWVLAQAQMFYFRIQDDCSPRISPYVPTCTTFCTRRAALILHVFRAYAVFCLRHQQSRGASGSVRKVGRASIDFMCSAYNSPLPVTWLIPFDEAPDMPMAAPTNRPQTIKQAKAAYKSRGQPSLTEQEKRQLDRAVELDRRAWRSKEYDKRKADAAKKKAESDKKQKEDLERLRLGSQRRCDRFGHKSSQMHLGAFLGKPNAQPVEINENLPAIGGESKSESFGDDELDDETLLDAITSTDQPIVQHTNPQQAHPLTNTAPTSIHQSKMTSTSQHTINIPAPAMEDFDTLWEDLDSSTQIARDLAIDELHQSNRQTSSKASSFSSGEFDLTTEDMDELDPPPPVLPKLEQDKKLMPPPTLPQRPDAAIAPAKTEFTMCELERFIDDDLQLTQVEPG